MAEIDSLEIKVTAGVEKATSSIDNLGKKLNTVSTSLNSSYKNSEKFSSGLKTATTSTDKFLESIKGLGSNRNFFGGQKELEKEITSVKNKIEKAKANIEQYENAGKGLGTKGWESQQRQLESLTNYLDNLIKKRDDFANASRRKIDWATVHKNSEERNKQASTQNLVNPTEKLSKTMSTEQAEKFKSAALAYQQSWEQSLKTVSQDIDNFSKKVNGASSSMSTQKLSERLSFEPSKLGKGQSYTKEYTSLEKDIAKAEAKLEKFLNTQERLDSLGVKKDSQRYKNVENSIEDADKKLQALYKDMQMLQESGGDINKPTSIDKFADGTKNAQQVFSQFAKALRLGNMGEVATKFQQLGANMGSLSNGLSQASAGAGELGASLGSIGVAVPVIGIALASIVGIGVAAKKVATVVVNAFKKIANGISFVVTKVRDIAKSIISIGTGTHQATTLIGKMWNKVVGIVKTRILRQAVSKALEFAKKGIDDLAKYSNKMGTDFNKNLSMLVSDFKYLGRVLATAFEPILNTAAPILDFLIQKLVTVINYINQFFSALTGSNTWTKATYNAENYASSIDKASGSAKELNKQLREFDKLNVITDPNKGGGSGGSGGGSGADNFETLPVNNNIQKFADKIKESWENADFTEVGGIVAQKIGEALDSVDWDKAKTYSTKFGSSLATFILGLVDWQDKDSQNLAQKIGNFVAQGINTFVDGIDSFVSKLLEKDDSGNTGFKRIGLWVASGVKSAVENIEWSKMQDVAGKIGKGLADLINGLSSGDTLSSISKAFANVLKLAINTAYSFVTGLDFSNLGTKVGEAINTFFETMSKSGTDGLNGWQKLGSTASNIASGIISMFTNALEKVKWSNIGDSIRDFLTSIDWISTLKNASKLKKAIGDAIVELFKEAIITYFVVKNSIISAFLSEVSKMTVSDWLEVGKKIASFVIDATISKFGGFWTLLVNAITGHGAGNEFTDGLQEKISNAIGNLKIDKEKLEQFAKSTASDLLTYLQKKINENPALKAIAEITGWSDKIDTGIKVLNNFSSNVDKYNDKITTNRDLDKFNAKLSGYSKDKTFNSSVSMTANLKKRKVDKSVKTPISIQAKLVKGKDTMSGLSGITAEILAKFKTNTRNIEVVDANGVPHTVYLKENGGIFENGKWSNISQFASGGIPSHGTAFVAGEHGPEIVGHVGGRTEVLNQSQLASAMYSSVANANAETNALLRQQNRYLSAILEKETGISYKDVFNAARKGNDEFKAINGNSAFA